MRARSRPERVSIAYTSSLYRPLSQSVRPSAETLPMSGLAGGGICQVATTRRVLKLTSEMLPASRLETYMTRASRLA
jgi:hypothetical protein